MRGYRRLGWYQPRVIALLMTLGISLLSGTMAQATPQYDLKCVDCHRLPPLDSANGDRVPATGAFKGNHGSHADTSAQSCVKCHGAGVLVYDASHRTKAIQVQAGINGSATGNYYSRPFLNQTSVPPNPLGTCSNVNCHFERTSPAWGSAPMSSPADCNSCHGTAPTAGHPVTGSKHAAYYGTGTSSCINCHTDHSAEAKPFAHATSVTHRAISVVFNAAPNNGGSYSGPTNDFLPSQTNTFGTCSGIYCHSDGTTKTGPFTVTTAPTWGGGTLGCSDCHGGSATLATGKHQAHVNNPGTLGTSYGCADCHAKTASSNSQIAVTANHVNTFVEYSGAKAGKNYSNGTCSTTYCHSSGKKGQAGVAATVEPSAPSWSGANMVCNGCHGAKPMGTAGVAFPSVAGEPNYASSGLAAANSHEKHVGAAGATTCGNCHAKTTTTGSSIIAGSQHIDGFINYTSASRNFGKAANKTCSNISCHSGNGKVSPVADAQWGTTLNCNGCHGGPVGLATNRIASGSHPQHTNQALVIGDNMTCAECHANTVSGDTAIGTPGNHMNNFVDYSGAKAGKRSTVVGGTCSATYCHTSGKKGVVAATVEPASPNWSGGTMGCKGCHGAKASGTAGIEFDSVAGEPNYVSAGLDAANSHKKHTSAGATSCSGCHSKTTVNGTSVIAGSQHLDRLANYTSATLGFGKAANKSCSNITCHSGNGRVTGVPDAQWGATLNCNGCHGGPAALLSNKLATGKHQQHMDQANVLGDNMGCAECHAKTVSSDSQVSQTGNHMNTFVEYSGVRAGKSTTYAAGTCSATYCHSSGKKGQAGMVATVEPAAPSWSGAAMGCNGCHGAKPMGTAGVAFNSAAGEPNYVSSGLAAANSHEKHVGAAGASSCTTCHSKTTVNGTTLIAGNQHLNGLANYTSANGVFGRAANKSCSNNNCHSSNGKVPAVADAQWGTTLNCNGCHGGPVSLATNRMSTGAHAKHTNQASVIGDNLACAECHANTVASDTALGTPGNHMNNFVDYSGAKAGKRSTVVGGTCSATYCHSSGKKGAVVATVEPAAPSWSGGLMGCNGCHGAQGMGTAGIEFASAAGEPNYISGQAGSETANSHKKHVGSGGAATCSKCHSKTTGNGTSIIAGSQHLDRFANFTSANGGFGKLAGKTCSNISCHSGNGRVAGVADAQWGATLDCNGCHGGPAALTTNILATGKHGAHINAPAAGGNYGCVECHSKTVSSDTQIADTTVHADTFVNYSGVKAGKSTSYSGGVCSATYCHSSGKKGLTGMAATVEPASPSWSGAALGCNGCHGAKLMGTAGVAFTSVAGEPNYTSGAAGSPSANSHAKHVKTDGAITCVLCHSATVDATGTAIIGNHTNKVADVQNGGTASFGYPGSKTCSNVSCHGGAGFAAANIVWGATADCKSCHGTLSAGHTRHVGTNAVWGSLPFYNFTANRSSGSDTDGVTKANYFFGCANCHPLTLASHLNGSVEVEMNTAANASALRKMNTAAGIIGSTGTGTVSCSNVYCHENVTTPQWNQTFTAAGRCSGCHENAPSTDSHAAHKVGIHYDDIFSGTSGVLPAAGAVGVNAGHGDPAQSTTIGCNICHYNTVKLPRNKYNSSCSTAACHGNTTGNNADTVGAARISDLSFHVNGKNDVAFQPSAYMKSKAQVTDAAFVSYTGGLGGWNKTRTYKAGASSYDTSKNYLTITSYNSGNCSNISCHNGVTVHWVNDFGGARDCTMCHTNL